VLVIEGAPLTNRRHVALPGQIVVAIHGGTVGADSVSTNLPHRLVAGERVLLALSPDDSAALWRIDMQWVVRVDGLAYGNQATPQPPAALIAALQSAAVAPR
jgi:hypothetical protein